MKISESRLTSLRNYKHYISFDNILNIRRKNITIKNKQIHSYAIYLLIYWIAYNCDDTHCRALIPCQISMPSFTPLPLFHLSRYASLDKWSNLYITLHTFPDPPKQNLTITDKDKQKTSQTHPMNKRASRPTTETYRTDPTKKKAPRYARSGFTPTRARQPDKRRKETQTTRLPTWKVESAATKILTPKSQRKLIAPKILHKAPRKAENDHKKHNSADPETHFLHATKIYPAATM